MSHETSQLVNSFECLLLHTVLDIKDFLQFIPLNKCLTHIYFTVKSVVFQFPISQRLYVVTIRCSGVTALCSINQVRILFQPSYCINYIYTSANDGNNPKKEIIFYIYNTVEIRSLEPIKLWNRNTKFKQSMYIK